MSEAMDKLWAEFDKINGAIETVTTRKLSRPITLNIWGQPNGAYKKADADDQARLNELTENLKAVEAEIAELEAREAEIAEACEKAVQENTANLLSAAETILPEFVRARDDKAREGVRSVKEGRQLIRQGEHRVADGMELLENAQILGSRVRTPKN